MPGKLGNRFAGLNINVGSLRPGAGPPKRKKKAVDDSAPLFDAATEAILSKPIQTNKKKKHQQTDNLTDEPQREEKELESPQPQAETKEPEPSSPPQPAPPTATEAKANSTPKKRKPKTASASRNKNNRTPSKSPKPRKTKPSRSPTRTPKQKPNAKKRSPRTPSRQQEEKESAPAYSVGDSVILVKDRAGTVRFVGPVEFAQGTWYGIELDEQFVGRSDGSKDGKRYFQTDENRAMFVQERKIKRRMTRSDHERRTSFLEARAKATPVVEEEQPPPIVEEPESEPIISATEDEEKTIVLSESPAQPEPPEVVEQPQVEAPPPVVEEPEPSITVPEDPEESVEAPLQPQATPSSSFYPAKAGESLLQFVVHQSDESLRSDLLKIYQNPKAGLQSVFDDLKHFEPEIQCKLLLDDLLPRLQLSVSRC